MFDLETFFERRRLRPFPVTMFQFHNWFPRLHTHTPLKQTKMKRLKHVTTRGQVHLKTKKNPIHELEIKKGLWEESRCAIYKVMYDVSTKNNL